MHVLSGCELQPITFDLCLISNLLVAQGTTFTLGSHWASDPITHCKHLNENFITALFVRGWKEGILILKRDGYVQ
jgi:hypothetical protein